MLERLCDALRIIVDAVSDIRIYVNAKCEYVDVVTKYNWRHIHLFLKLKKIRILSIFRNSKTEWDLVLEIHLFWMWTTSFHELRFYPIDRIKYVYEYLFIIIKMSSLPTSLCVVYIIILTFYTLQRNPWLSEL